MNDPDYFPKLNLVECEKIAHRWAKEYPFIKKISLYEGTSLPTNWRTVPVSARLKGVLERHLDNLGPEDYVFTDRHGKYTNVRIYNKFKHLCKRAKVKQCMAILFTSF